jgi:hypothetical protein
MSVIILSDRNTFSHSDRNIHEDPENCDSNIDLRSNCSVDSNEVIVSHTEGTDGNSFGDTITPSFSNMNIMSSTASASDNIELENDSGNDKILNVKDLL